VRYQKRSEPYIASLGKSPLSGQSQNPGSRPASQSSLIVNPRIYMECTYVSQWQIPFPFTHASYFRKRRMCYFVLFTAVWVGQRPFIYSHKYVHNMNIFISKKDLHIRISSRRHDKLKAYAQNKEKTVMQLIEDWIDRLPIPKVGDSSSTNRPVNPYRLN